MTEDKTVGVPTSYKVKLNVSERLNISSLFPESSDKLQMQIMEDITDRTKLTPNEKDDLDFAEREVMTDRGLTTHWNWDPEKGRKEKQFEFTKTEMRFLKIRLKDLDGQKKITRVLWPLFKKLDAFKPGEEKEKDE